MDCSGNFVPKEYFNSSDILVNASRSMLWTWEGVEFNEDSSILLIHCTLEILGVRSEAKCTWDLKYVSVLYTPCYFLYVTPVWLMSLLCYGCLAPSNASRVLGHDADTPNTQHSSTLISTHILNLQTCKQLTQAILLSKGFLDTICTMPFLQQECDGW